MKQFWVVERASETRVAAPATSSLQDSGRLTTVAGREAGATGLMSQLAIAGRLMPAGVVGEHDGRRAGIHSVPLTELADVA